MGKRLNELKVSRQRSEQALERMIWCLAGVVACLVVLIWFGMMPHAADYDELEAFRGAYSELETVVDYTHGGKGGKRSSIHYRLVFEDGGAFTIGGGFEAGSFFGAVEPGDELVVLANTSKVQDEPIVYEITNADGEVLLSYEETAAKHEQIARGCMGLAAILGTAALVRAVMWFVKWRKNHRKAQELSRKKDR